MGDLTLRDQGRAGIVVGLTLDGWVQEHSDDDPTSADHWFHSNAVNGTSDSSNHTVGESDAVGLRTYNANLAFRRSILTDTENQSGVATGH